MSELVRVRITGDALQSALTRVYLNDQEIIGVESAMVEYGMREARVRLVLIADTIEVVSLPRPERKPKT